MNDDNVISLHSEDHFHPRISEAAVNINCFKVALDRAVIGFEIDDEGDIYVNDGLEFPFWISIDTGSKLVRFYTWWQEDNGSLHDVNELNRTYKAVQFCLQEGKISGSYYFTYKYGLDSRHFIIMARQFSAICRSGKEHMDDTVLKRDQTSVVAFAPIGDQPSDQTASN